MYVPPSYSSTPSQVANKWVTGKVKDMTDKMSGLAFGIS